MNLGIYKKRIISNIRFIIKLSACCLLYYSGGIRLYRRINKKKSNGKGIKILAYHDIGAPSFFNLQVPEEIFLSHVKYLLESNYNLISLEEAAELLKSKRPIPDDTVVITFDDGYKSIYKNVLSTVKQYNIPVTVFLSTEPVEKRRPLFVDALAYAFENTKNKKLNLTSWTLKEYPIGNQDLKEMAGYEINEYSKDLRSEDRRKFLEFIFEKLDVDLDSQELRDRMLSWDEVVESSRSGVSFGVHTVTHPSLARISNDEAGDEILGSKKIMEEKLNSEVKTFAYPYGSAQDVSEAVRQIVIEKNFLCAVTLQNGVNNGGSDLFMLKRVCITNQLRYRPLWIFARAFFAVEMSGILKTFHGSKA